MEIRNHSEFKQTDEYLALRSTLNILHLDQEELLTRFFNKINDSGVTSVFRTVSVTMMQGGLLMATFKTVVGDIALKVYRRKNTDIFEVSVLDIKSSTTTPLFTLQSTAVD